MKELELNGKHYVSLDLFLENKSLVEELREENKKLKKYLEDSKKEEENFKQQYKTLAKSILKTKDSTGQPLIYVGQKFIMVHLKYGYEDRECKVEEVFIDKIVIYKYSWHAYMYDEGRYYLSESSLIGKYDLETGIFYFHKRGDHSQIFYEDDIEGINKFKEKLKKIIQESIKYKIQQAKNDLIKYEKISTLQDFIYKAPNHE